MVDLACSLCTQEAEAGGLQCSPGQHELQNQSPSQKKKSKFSKKNVGEVAK